MSGVRILLPRPWRLGLHRQANSSENARAAARAIEYKYRYKAGMIYVLHFSRPYKHATHYIGYSRDDAVEDRIATQLSGGSRAARLIQVVVAADITVELGAVLKGDRTEERRLKIMGAAKPSRGLRSICALCRYLIKEKSTPMDSPEQE